MAQKPAELCVALDGSDRQWILDAAASLTSEVDWLKVGLEAFVAHGPGIVTEIAASSGRVFLDLKLHDIPATVRRAAANAARCGARMVTVHAGGGEEMLAAAVEGAGLAATGQPMKVVAVTVLTSLDDDALERLGIPGPTGRTVLRWAEMAARCGADGVVASPREAAAIRSACGPEFIIVTPGVRPSWHGVDDQRRTLTPAQAVRQGSNVLVVGRPITRAPSPVEAARTIRQEMNREPSE